MSLFEKKPEIPRTQFKDILKKADVKVRGRQLSERELANIEKVDFPKRFGSTISKSEFDRTINRLEGQKRVEQDFTKKIKMGKKIEFLEGLEKGDTNKK